MKIIKDSIKKAQTLKRKQFYALMVEGSNVNKKEATKLGYTWNSKLTQWDAGIECTSEKGRYISKNFLSRYNPYRGRTLIVEIEKKDKICKLS